MQSSFSQILFLGKVSDELVVKVVEVKKIQGNAHIGSIKCFTREFFSFHPMVGLVAPNSMHSLHTMHRGVG